MFYCIYYDLHSGILNLTCLCVLIIRVGFLIGWNLNACEKVFAAVNEKQIIEFVKCDSFNHFTQKYNVKTCDIIFRVQTK